MDGNKLFIIYYSRSNDPRPGVTKRHKRAEETAHTCESTIFLVDINIDTASNSEKNFFGGETIECVTVVGNTVLERETHPGRKRIEEMIKTLCTAGTNTVPVLAGLLGAQEEDTDATI